MPANIPLAVSPSTKRPGVYLSVNLFAGASSPGTAPLRALVISPKTSAGTITVDTQIKEALAGKDEARTVFGPGALGHLACVRLFDRFGTARVDAVAPTASTGVAAVGSFIFTGTPTSTCTFRVWAQARKFEISWFVGETANSARDRMIALMNAATELHFVASSSVTAGKVTMTAKVAGLSGNDLRFYVEQLDGAGGSIGTLVAFTGGTLEPSFTAVLALVQQRKYDIIVACVSNADAEDNSGSSNISKIKTHMATYAQGLGARLQTALVGVTSATDSGPKAGSIKINDGPVEYVFCMNAQELPCEFAGFEAGDRLDKQSKKFGNPNRLGTIFTGFLGAYDKVADNPSDVEIEDWLNNGLAPLAYTAQNDVYLVAPITTHSQDSSGNPDYRAYWVTDVTGTYAFASDLQTALPQEFFQVNIIADQQPGEEELPPDTVEERDVRSFVDTRAEFFIKKGVLRRDKWEEAKTNGTFIGQIDVSDDAQFDLVIPVNIVKPWAKTSLVVQKNP